MPMGKFKLKTAYTWIQRKKMFGVVCEYARKSGNSSCLKVCS